MKERLTSRNLMRKSIYYYLKRSIYHSIANTRSILGFCFIVFAISACSSFTPEKLYYDAIEVSKPKSTIEYGVYTPPGWTPKESLPLILFLHGGGDNHTSFEKFKAHEYFDSQIAAGNIPRVILLTPNGKNGFWENWYDGTHNYRDWVLNEVMPKVQEDYNILSCPEHCHLAGISMGGFGALRFAFFAKERFSSVSAISAPILNEEENKQAKKSILIRLLFPLGRIFGPNFSESYADQKIEKVWVNDKELQKMRLQLIVGDDDREQIIKANKRFHDLLAKNNIPHDFVIYEGGHKWKYWIPNFGNAINFLVKEPKSP
ncbi:MAG: enterochelin esterase-like enzyme [Cellvibrionaceae bacterium]|jgi:enterochelin esterase-like enzyme